jgi:hypothetical protein
MPRKRVPRTAATQAVVVAAFLDSGGRKAGTPLEMASTPVSAVQPEENARSRRNRVRPAMGAGASAT